MALFIRLGNTLINSNHITHTIIKQSNNSCKTNLIVYLNTYQRLEKNKQVTITQSSCQMKFPNKISAIEYSRAILEPVLIKNQNEHVKIANDEFKRFF